MGAVDGYYAYSGAGAIYDDANSAATGSSEWGSSYINATGNEVGGSVWCFFEICSSTIQGGQSGWSFTMDFSFSDIPNGTSPGAWWRAQFGFSSPSSDLAGVNNANSALGTSYPLYTGTGNGSVLLYGAQNGWQECVLVSVPSIWQNLGACP